MNLVVSWCALLFDLSTYGLHQFWPAIFFLVGYSYLGLPLMAGFARILWPGIRRVRGDATGSPSSPIALSRRVVEDHYPDARSGSTSVAFERAMGSGQ